MYLPCLGPVAQLAVLNNFLCGFFSVTDMSLRLVSFVNFILFHDFWLIRLCSQSLCKLKKNEAEGVNFTYGLDFADSAYISGKKNGIASEWRYCSAWQNLCFFYIEKMNLAQYSDQ